MKFIDLFSGIGGFRIAFEDAGFKCVFSSEIENHARETYNIHFGEYPSGDITKIDPVDIPDFDVLCGGFPCQPFTMAGSRDGFTCDNGLLVYSAIKILKEKQPKAFLLENVPGLLSIDHGKSFAAIIKELSNVGYNVSYKVLNAKNFNLPQHRNRLFIVGMKNGTFNFPNTLKEKTLFKDIVRKNTESQYIPNKTPSVKKMLKKWKIINDADYCQTVITSHCSFYNPGVIRTDNGWIRYMTVRECLLAQGLPENYELDGNLSAQYKQIGNSIPINVVREIAKEILKQLKKPNKTLFDF